MGFDRWMSRLVQHRRGVALVSLMVAFTGLTMVLNPSHAPELPWIGLPVLVAGAALLALLAWPPATFPPDERIYLSARLIQRLTLHGRLVRFFPGFGIALVVADLGYNFLLSTSPAFLTEDILVLLSAGALLAYGLVPANYAKERDFALLFFLFLNLILVAPLLGTRLATRNVDASVDVYSWIALAPEVSVILSLLGVSNSVHAVSGYTAPGISFTPTHFGAPVTVVISTACSGIYSFGIFAAAFLAFVVTEYSSPSRRVWVLLGLGFLASYAANLLRMVIIILIGFSTDSAQTDLQNMLLAHSYAGWVIFLAWVALFWGLLFKFLPFDVDRKPQGSSLEPGPPARRRTNVCGICQEALSPAIPGSRCACGALYHWACLVDAGRCSVCHRKVSRIHASPAESN
jgi:exosortase/archaeosortase family protein